MCYKNVLISWFFIFATVSSVAWAISFTYVYGPPSKPVTELDIAKYCVQNEYTRHTEFCLRIAKKIAETK